MASRPGADPQQMLADLRSLALARRAEAVAWERVVAAEAGMEQAVLTPSVVPVPAVAGVPQPKAVQPPIAALAPQLAPRRQGALAAKARREFAPPPPAAASPLPQAVRPPLVEVVLESPATELLMAQALGPRPTASEYRANIASYQAGVARQAAAAAATFREKEGRRPVRAAAPAADCTESGSSSCDSDGHAELVAHIKELVRGLYQERKPEKVAGVDDLFAKYRGQEYEAYCAICRKYGGVPYPKERLGRGCPGRRPVSRSTSASRSGYTASEARLRGVKRAAGKSAPAGDESRGRRGEEAEGSVPKARALKPRGSVATGRRRLESPGRAPRWPVSGGLAEGGAAAEAAAAAGSDQPKPAESDSAAAPAEAGSGGSTPGQWGRHQWQAGAAAASCWQGADTVAGKAGGKKRRARARGNRDWWCGECRRSNFAKRQCCRFCDRPRPAKAPADAEAEGILETGAPVGAEADRAVESAAPAGAEEGPPERRRRRSPSGSE